MGNGASHRQQPVHVGMLNLKSNLADRQSGGTIHRGESYQRKSNFRL